MAPDTRSTPFADDSGVDAANAIARKHWETFKRKHLLKPVVRRREGAARAPEPVESTQETLPENAPTPAPLGPTIAPAPRSAATTVETFVPDAKLAPTEVPAEPRDAEAALRTGHKTGLSIAAALASTAVGAYLLWNKGAPIRPAYLALYAACTLGFALLGVRPLMGHHPTHASLGVVAPVAWAAVALAWPALAAVVVLVAIAGMNHGTPLWQSAALALVPAGAAVWTMSRVGAMLTMRAPWPSPIGEGFRGWGSALAWLGLVVTVALDFWLLTDTRPIDVPRFSQPSPAVSEPEAKQEATSQSEPQPVPPRRGTKARPAAPATPAAAATRQETKPGDTPQAVGTTVSELLAQARDFDRAGQVEAAISRLEKAWQLDPSNTDIALALARGQRIAKKYEQENRTLRQLIEQQPRNSAALLALGDNLLRLRGGADAVIDEAAALYAAGHAAASDPNVALSRLRRQAAEIGQESARARAAQRALDIINAPE